MESQGCIYKTVEAAQERTLGVSQRIAFRSQADLLGSFRCRYFRLGPGRSCRWCRKGTTHEIRPYYVDDRGRRVCDRSAPSRSADVSKVQTEEACLMSGEAQA